MEWREQVRAGGFEDAVEMEFRMAERWRTFTT
jgi:hypothetical protein